MVKKNILTFKGGKVYMKKEKVTHHLQISQKHPKEMKS